MKVLGWHGSWWNPTRLGIAPPRRSEVTGHDASAAIFDNGVLVAAVEEERLSRVKHTQAFPARAIRTCLDRAGLEFSDLDAIATDVAEPFLDNWVSARRLWDGRNLPAGGRALIADIFESEFGVQVGSKLRFCAHHVAHSIGAQVLSGYSDVLSVCIDASGDGPSGLIASFTDGEMSPLRYLSMRQSLGTFFVRCIALLGYRLFDEYKVMGLAPYGDPSVYRNAISRLYRCEPDGRYTLACDDEIISCFTEDGLLPILRSKGSPFGTEHGHFAASLQEALENIVMHVLEHYRKATGLRTLCLSGGVAHNCTMNGKILSSGLFERVYVQPAAHDGGNAIGAALSVLNVEDRRRTRPLADLYLGSSPGSDEAIRTVLSGWSGLIEHARCDDPPREAAHLIARGDVIGWVQGRSEFGPRALGNRSILADPRPAENKSRINGMVKKREGYRPFAPSVLEHRLKEFFVVPDLVTSLPYMTFVVGVQEDKQALLGAITHVDGTARVQTVSKAQNPSYHALIEEFERLSGMPMVLNTSFNNHAEPIVDDVDDAVSTFMSTDINTLIVGNWIVRKKATPAVADALRDLVPAIAVGYRLIARPKPDGSMSHVLATDPMVHPSANSLEITPAAASILLAPAAQASIRERCEAAQLDACSVTNELAELWRNRALVLRPVARLGVSTSGSASPIHSRRCWPFPAAEPVEG